VSFWKCFYAVEPEAGGGNRLDALTTTDDRCGLAPQPPASSACTFAAVSLSFNGV
jgi:hypothetical protein